MRSRPATQAACSNEKFSDPFALDDCDSLSFASKSPRSDDRAPATPENHQIKFFHCLLHAYVGEEFVLRFMRIFLFERSVHASLALI